MAVNLQKEIGIVSGEIVIGNVTVTVTVIVTGKETEIVIKTGTGTVIEVEIETGIVIAIATGIVTEIGTGTEKGVGGVIVIEIVTRAGIGTGNVIVTVTGRERETGTGTGENLSITMRTGSKFLVHGQTRCHLNSSSKGRSRRNQVSWNGYVTWRMTDTPVLTGMTAGTVIALYFHRGIVNSLRTEVRDSHYEITSAVFAVNINI
jgi:hypothetical protein